MILGRRAGAIALPPLAHMANEVRVPTIRCQHSTGEDGGLEINFHDVIGAWWDESTSGDVARALSASKGKPVRVSINSPGGLAYDGIGIYNLLVAHDGPVTTTVVGVAASAASIIMQAGDVRRIHDNASVMIHRALVGIVGNAGELAAEIKVLNMIDKQLARVYAARSGTNESAWLDAMAGPKDQDGTWYDAESAVDAGLADEIVSTGKASAKNELPEQPTTAPNQLRTTTREAVAIRLQMLELDT